MRRTLTACRAGLAAGAAFVLLTACGGGTDTDKDAASSPTTETTTSSQAGNDAPEADSEFCTQAQALTTTLESAFGEESSDPGSVAQQFQQIASAMRTLDPPPEISDDWETLANGLDQFAAAFAQFNPNDPASASSFAQQSQELEGQLTTAGANVEKYLTEQCGIDTGESATPTS
jgi:hypothetical protein